MDTVEWHAVRCGYLTASVADEVCKRLKNGAPAASYKERMAKVIAERITGMPIITPATSAMLWGKEHEEEAAEAYECRTGALAVGDGETFIPHPELEYFGASPDRFIGDDGLLEIKCPETLTHLSRVLSGEIPEMYKRQMQVQLLCTGRRWVDFVDYDPRLLGTNCASLALWIKRYVPTPEELAETLALCREFLEDAARRMEQIKALANSMENNNGRI